MITRRAFIKTVTIALTGTGVLSCNKNKNRPRRHDTDALPVPKDREIPMQDRELAEAGYNNRVVRMKVTAYCPCSKCCGKWADSVTASGHIIKKGDRFVVADKSHPFGTEMYVPGYYRETVDVLDRGEAIKGNHIDVYFDSHQEALNWGVKYLDVVILSFSDVEYEK